MPKDIFYKNLDELSALLAKKLTIEKREDSKIIVNGIEIDTNEQTSILSIESLNIIDPGPLFKQVLQEFGIVPQGDRLDIPLHSVALRVSMFEGKEKQHKICIDHLEKEFENRRLELKNTKKILFHVRGISRTIKNDQDYQDARSGGGHHQLLLVDKDTNTISYINDSTVPNQEDAQAFKEQIEDFLSRIEGSQITYQLQVYDDKSRLPEDKKDYIGQGCGVSLFLSYCALLNGVETKDIRQTIPFKVAVLIYLFQKISDGTASEGLQKLCKKVCENVLNEINPSQPAFRVTTPLTDRAQPKAVKASEHNVIRKTAAERMSPKLNQNTETPSQPKIHDNGITLSEGATNNFSLTEEFKTHLSKELQDCQNTLRDIQEETDSGMRFARIESYRSKISSLLSQSEGNAQLSLDAKAMIRGECTTLLEQVDKLDTLMRLNSPNSEVKWPVSSLPDHILTRVWQVSCGLLGIGVVVGLCGGPLWIATIGILMTAVTSALLASVWIYTRLFNSADKASSESGSAQPPRFNFLSDSSKTTHLNHAADTATIKLSK